MTRMESDYKLSYERYLQEVIMPYNSWLQDMYLENSKEKHQDKEEPFEDAEAYEKQNYDFLEDRYINFCIAQYNLYVNDGEMDIEITFFDD